MTSRYRCSTEPTHPRGERTAALASNRHAIAHVRRHRRRIECAIKATATWSPHLPPACDQPVPASAARTSRSRRPTSSDERRAVWLRAARRARRAETSSASPASHGIANARRAVAMRLGVLAIVAIHRWNACGARRSSAPSLTGARRRRSAQRPAGAPRRKARHGQRASAPHNRCDGNRGRSPGEKCTTQIGLVLCAPSANESNA
jgi:hypothetical protein